jgi:hypothetical protein
LETKQFIYYFLLFSCIGEGDQICLSIFTIQSVYKVLLPVLGVIYCEPLGIEKRDRWLIFVILFPNAACPAVFSTFIKGQKITAWVLDIAHQRGNRTLRTPVSISQINPSRFLVLIFQTSHIQVNYSPISRGKIRKLCFHFKGVI